MAKINVTPAEFSEIQKLSGECVNKLNGRFDEDEWRRKLGFILSTRMPVMGMFDVVVRTDVPYIPFFSQNVKRFEE